MSRWTNEQQNAIDASGHSVIVSAAAGSGKTSVLVERLIRIISDRENKVPVEKIVVTTFTNDAAAEMKQRLSQSLLKLIEENPQDKWLSRQHSMIGSASISTTHSFCFNLLRSNITKLSLSGGFIIMEETEEKLLKNSAIKKVFEDYYENEPDLMKLLNDNFCGGDDRPLENIVLDLYGRISSIPFYKSWFKRIIKNYDTDLYSDYYISYIKNRFDMCDNLWLCANKIAKEINHDKLLETLKKDKLLIDSYVSAINDGDIDSFCGLIKAFKLSNFPAASKTEENPDERIFIKNIREHYKNMLKELKENSPDLLTYMKSDTERHKDILSGISKLIFSFADELSNLKEQKNAVSFDDAEQLALGLLAECDENGNIVRTELAKELSEYYEIIMIDEFQDSNNRQDMIFRLLSKGGSAESYGSNLFFVGDVKQSIYRFRLANPGNFINAVNDAVPYNKEVKQNSYIKLNKNFRSSKEVVEFVNYVFNCIMSCDTGDIDYKNDEELIQGAEFYPSDRKTEIIILDKSREPDNAEAACVAEKISAMLKDGTLVSIDGGKSYRPCEPRDFCILSRKRKNFSLFADELEIRGVIAECEETDGYLKSREISVLMNLLRVIDNPLDDTALTSVMLSPMFVMNIDDAAMIRLVDKKAYMYNNIVTALNTQENELCDELAVKLQFLYSTIKELRMYASIYTVQELIQKIYDSTDFLSVMQLYRDSEKKKANLRMLLEYASGYEKNSNGGLSGFIRYIDRIMDTKGDFQSASEGMSTRNAVSIKTMHKSKGLEFPFVFIVETSDKFNKLDSIKAYQFSDKLGIGFRLQNKEKYERFKTIPFEAIKLSNEKDDLSEEMRIFYVALTRAKEKLFITLDVSESQQKKAELFAADIGVQNGITPLCAASAASMEDWLIMSLISHRKSGKFREAMGILECFKYDADWDIHYEKYKYSEPESEFKEIQEKGDAKASEEDIDFLNKILNSDYDMRFSGLTAKLSVSDISKDNADYKIPLKRPLFAREDKGLTNAEKGTALHRFLQFTDYNALEVSFESELERLFESGYLTDVQRDVINKSDVEAFLSSSLYNRIKNSKNFIREKKFLVSIDDIGLDDEFGRQYEGTDGMLNGIIDMIIEEEDSITLVDYKTDRVSDLIYLADKYRGQLLLYKKTLEKLQPKPVSEAIIYSFYKKTEIKVF